MTSPEHDLKEAYERLEQAIRDVTHLEGWKGLVTDWVVVAADQYFADNGRTMTAVGWLLPEGGDRVPHYRLVGLLDVALTACRAGHAPEECEGGE
ncbi:hypothetical protein [Streptomyces sp. NPDC088178]|uniref:hypothetical protein n=1 Tax=Streptomyces sp. NPDC088178 TaxID=3365836 RepID=UPI0037F6A77A